MDKGYPRILELIFYYHSKREDFAQEDFVQEDNRVICQSFTGHSSVSKFLV